MTRVEIEDGAALYVISVAAGLTGLPPRTLRELDRMEFYVYETREMLRAKHLPLVIITSNN